MLEGRKPFLGKRIDIASDEVTGEQAANILSNLLGQRIRYVPVPLQQAYQGNEDMARMYEWYEKVGTGKIFRVFTKNIPKSTGLLLGIGLN